MLRQRIKYLVQEGGAYPHELPASRQLVIRLAIGFAALEFIFFLVDHLA